MSYEATGIPLIYIAGPFTAPTRSGVDANIRSAEAVGIIVAKYGGMPVIPHSNTSHPDFEIVQGYEFWVTGTAKLMARCDGVVLAPKWRASRGAMGEFHLAKKIGLPILEFTETADVGNWVETLKGTK